MELRQALIGAACPCTGHQACCMLDRLKGKFCRPVFSTAMTVKSGVVGLLQAGPPCVC